MKNNIILPRTNEDGLFYLSYSQISTWKKSKREYIRQYFLGEKDTKDILKPYGDFGHKVGESLEHNDFKGFISKERKLMKSIPRYDEFERKIFLQMDGFIIEGYIDTNTKPKDYENGKGVHIRRIADYKTGEIKKRKAEYESKDYIQTELYSAALQQEFGVLPDDVSVILIQRDGNAFKGEKLKLGDKFITITKKMDEERIKEVLKEVNEIALEISQHYKLFLKMNELI